MFLADCPQAFDVFLHDDTDTDKFKLMLAHPALEEGYSSAPEVCPFRANSDRRYYKMQNT